LPAVRNGKVFAMDATLISRGQARAWWIGVELPAHLFHPELCEWRGPEMHSTRDVNSEVPTHTALRPCPVCGDAFPMQAGGAGAIAFLHLISLTDAKN